MHRIIDARYDLLPRHASKTWPERDTTLNVFTIHHSGSPASTTAYAIARYAVEQRGHPAAQYHYIIPADGKIWWANDDMRWVLHGHDFNDRGLGICLAGDFTSGEPTDAQISAVRWLYAQKQREHGHLRLAGHYEAPRANTACPGKTFPDWRGRIAEECPMLWLQVQGSGYEDWLVNHARQAGGVILINPENGNWRKFIDAGVKYVTGRKVWPQDADKGWIQQGAKGAELWFLDFWNTARHMPEIVIWRGPNEPAIWNAEDARVLDAFTARLADLFHDNGRKLIGLNFSTGHPDFGLWKYLGTSLSKIDFLGRHSYACEPPWFDRSHWWHPWRLVRDVEAIREVGRVPPIILGETGIDRNGNPHEDGWRARGVSAEEYTSRMAHYIIELGKEVPELFSAAPFVWKSTGWPSFDIAQRESEMLLNYWPADTEEQIGQAISDAIQAHVLPLNPAAALYRAAKAKDPLLVPGSNEVPGPFLGAPENTIAQMFRKDEVWQEIAWTFHGEWGINQIRWVRRAN